ncbi:MULTISPECIES: Txe/YoeB family addiction module toxin [Kocuria]|uniref:Endoribonuclease YoeB n=1 Tax=Kocuria marina subsp. indica TaxID=1049583 RepID=A0A1X7DEL9_9MICC|nr:MULTISPECIES: Txe/YoeB family addiction module toxin [Kocuria]MCT2362589.1 Txe/YoeB family addiction module toxin [Kocuria marina]OXS82715.1 toxin RelK [Kocuria indica]RLP57573.1 Txe/YoeB family addiction module toxin [Kocuria indica]WTI33388.1 Txe/YoeB family addiction module toxin [Kocuria rhizophila]SMF13958.1 toxin YoeB [Kocuria indica]
MRLVWDEAAWEDYTYWQTADRRILKRINLLIDACLREPFEGIGKPEQLKYGAQGSWSRRINEEHRLVYLVAGEDLVILQARYHY